MESEKTLLGPGPRSRVTRRPQRAAYDRDAIYAILDSSVLCHIGFQAHGQTFVIPTAYGRKDDSLFLHGSAASRMLTNLAEGAPLCVTVSHLDGFVLAKSAFHHSLNYRSAVLFGTAFVLEDEAEKTEALRIFMEHATPGRWDTTRPPTSQELKGTAVLRFNIEEASAKIRTGPPIEDEADADLPVWSGVLPIQYARGAPVAAKESAPGHAPPAWSFRDLKPEL